MPYPQKKPGQPRDAVFLAHGLNEGERFGQHLMRTARLTEAAYVGNFGAHHAAMSHCLGRILLARRPTGPDGIARPIERQDLPGSVFEKPDRADDALDDLDLLGL